MYRVPFLIFLTSTLLCAQAMPTVQGHIFSSDGSRVGGAAVTIAGASTFVGITETGTDPGHYISPAIPAGGYSITVQKDGFRSSAAKVVTLNQDGLTVDFVLEAACNSC